MQEIILQMTNKMTFSEKDKLKALAIVNIFETSKAFGSYAACVVLNDGAGVSYGIAQFTHRSGSLWEVVERYLNAGGQIGREVLTAAIPLLKRSNVASIETLASDSRFKKALIAAAVTREMKEAQHFVASTRYLRPAIDICTRLGFTSPLSLAEYLVDLSVVLDEANAPIDGRFVVVPAWFHGLLLKDERFVKSGTRRSDEAIRNGEVGEAAGFSILKSNNVPNTTGTKYKILAGHSIATAYVEQIVDVQTYKPEKRFGDAVKGLHVYGAKVVRPTCLAMLIASKA